MGRFVGRAKELRMLEEAFSSSASAFIPIYGRRRVGKSELILRFIADKPSVYHLGQQSAEPLQVHDFLVEAAQSLQLPLLAQLRVEGWQQALLTVVQQWTAANPRSKLVLALDEFQWTAAASPNLLSVLQHCWDRHWRDAGNVMLLLCGSYFGFMERDVLGAKSPLFGRRTAQILLAPFDYLEASLFHRRWAIADKAKAYFLVGGMPQYLLLLDDARSVEQNIRAKLLQEFSPLFHEPIFLLREELREIAPYQTILFAMAEGNGTATRIAAAAKVPERNVHYYLKQLVELRYIRRRYPLDGTSRNARQVRFRIEDPLLRFWFRFVFPNRSLIASGGVTTAFTERIRPSLDSWYGGGFENLCREALPLIYAREGVGAGYEVGEYWAQSVQIDVVGRRDDNWTDLGECKWGPVRSARALREELEHKVTAYANRRGATLGRRYFTRTKPKAAASDRGWYSLADLYALGG